MSQNNKFREVARFSEARWKAVKRILLESISFPKINFKITFRLLRIKLFRKGCNFSLQIPTGLVEEFNDLRFDLKLLRNRFAGSVRNKCKENGKMSARGIGYCWRMWKSRKIVLWTNAVARCRAYGARDMTGISRAARTSTKPSRPLA